MAYGGENRRDNGFSTPPPPQRRGNCFKCKEEGHWAIDCPSNSKSPSRKQSWISGDINVPMLRCRCRDRETCLIKTSGTQKNLNRKFYTCPNPKCDFFAFCDNYEVIMCPCGAGPCTINLGSGNRSKNNYYYTCRIRSGHGACGFIKFGSSRHPWNNEFVCVSHRKGKAFVAHNALSESSSIRSHEYSFDQCLVPVANRPLVSGLGSQTQIHLRQIQFLEQIASAGDSHFLSECSRVVYVLGVRVFGWMGRLVFVPLRSLADPPMHFLCNVDVNDSQSSASILPHNLPMIEVGDVMCRRGSSHKRSRREAQLSPRLEELMECHATGKRWFDAYAKMHQEAVSAFTTSDELVKFLKERAACLKNTLSDIEKQLLPCEAETLKLKNDAEELSRQMVHSRRRMQAAYREIRQAMS